MNKKTLPFLAIFLAILIAGLYYFQQRGDVEQDSHTNTKSAASADRNLVEIFHLPHTPAIAVVEKVEALLKKYPDYTIKKYDLDDTANAEIVAERDLSGHIPVAIFIGGKSAFTIGGQEVRFSNFPQSDAFIPSFSGSWDYADIEEVLANPDQY